MAKLLTAFRADPSDKNRAKLQSYINRHMMAVCMLSVEDIAFLKSNSFQF